MFNDIKWGLPKRDHGFRIVEKTESKEAARRRNLNEKRIAKDKAYKEKQAMIKMRTEP